MKYKLLVLVILVFGLTSCGNKVKNGLSPSEIVENMYKYANESDYNNMRKYFDEDSKIKIETEDQAKNYVNKKTNKGTIKDLEILYEKEDENDSLVRIKKTYSNNETETHRVELVKEEDEWRIVYAINELDYMPIPEIDLSGLWINEKEDDAIYIKQKGDKFFILGSIGKFDSSEGFLHYSRGVLVSQTEFNFTRIETYDNDKYAGFWENGEFPRANISKDDGFYRVLDLYSSLVTGGFENCRFFIGLEKKENNALYVFNAAELDDSKLNLEIDSKIEEDELFADSLSESSREEARKYFYADLDDYDKENYTYYKGRWDPEICGFYTNGETDFPDEDKDGLSDDSYDEENKTLIIRNAEYTR